MRFPAYSRGHSLLSPLSDKRTVPVFTGAEADAAACFSHGRRFSLLPPPLPSLPLEWRTPSSLPLDGSAVLNDRPVACQIRGPIRRETGAPISRRRQPPPTHCGASRRNGRDLIIATRPAHQPLPSLLSAAAAQEVQAIPEPTMLPTALHARVHTAKFALARPAPRDP